MSRDRTIVGAGPRVTDVVVNDHLAVDVQRGPGAYYLCWKGAPDLTACDRVAGHGGRCSWDHPQYVTAGFPPVPDAQTLLARARRALDDLQALL